MDKLIEQALKKHKIVRYLDTFEKVMLTYKTLLEAEMEAKNISSNPMLADSVAICKHEGCFLPATCKEYCDKTAVITSSG